MTNRLLVRLLCVLSLVTGTLAADRVPTTRSVAERMEFAKKWAAVAEQAAKEIADRQEKLNIYGDLLSVQASVGDAAGAATTVQNLIEWRPGGPAEARQSDTDRDNVFLAKAEAKAGQIASALRTAESIKEQTTKDGTYEEIASAQVALGDLSGAIATVERIDSPSDKVNVLAQIAIAAHHRGDRPGCEQILHRAESIGLLTGAKGAVGDALCVDVAQAWRDVGDIRQARRIQAQVVECLAKSQSPKEIREMTTVARAQIDIYDPGGALQTLDRLAQIVAKHPEVSLYYWDAASCRAEAGDSAGALVLVDAERNMTKRADGYLEIAQIQAKRGELEDAARTFQLARFAAAYIDESERRALMFLKIARSWREIGNRAEGLLNLARAERSIEFSVSQHVKGSLWAQLAIARADMGDIAGAKRLFELAKGVVRELKEDARAESYHFLAKCLMTVEFWEDAEQMLAQAGTAEWRDDLNEFMALARLEKDDIAGAKLLCGRIRGREQQRMVHIRMAMWLATDGDLASVDGLLSTLHDPSIRADAALGAALGAIGKPGLYRDPTLHRTELGIQD